MARAPRRKRYSGVLAKPMKPVISAERRRSLAPITDAEIGEGLARNLPDFIERWAALAEHYGIDRNARNAGWRLAHALARDHVPGFRVEGEDAAARGAGRKWDAQSRAVLWIAVRAMMEDGKTREGAAMAIFESADLRRYLPAEVTSGESLARQYEAINAEPGGFITVVDDLRLRSGTSYADLLNMFAPPPDRPNK